MEKDEEGRFTETRSDREVLDAVDAHTPAATAEVAEALDLTRQAVDYRLRRLREEGRVRSKKVGASLVWFAAEQPATGSEAVVEGDNEPIEDTTDTGAELAERIRSFDVPGSGSRLDERVAATVRVVEHLEAVGEASAEELKALLDDDAVGYADVASYWANFVRGAKVLKQLDEVEAPTKGEKQYRWVGR